MASFSLLGKTTFIIDRHGHGGEHDVKMLLVWDHSLGLAQLGNVWELHALHNYVQLHLITSLAILVGGVFLICIVYLGYPAIS